MTKTFTRRSIFGAAVCTAAAFLMGAPAAQAANGLEHLEGKRITWTVPFGEGGGSDGLARLFQPYLQDKLGATVVVLNQPGGGSVTGVNKFTREAKTDGTDLLIASTSTFVNYTMAADKVRYNPLTWEPVMGLPRGAVIYANPEKTGVMGGGKDVVGDVMKLREAKPTIGGKSPSSSELLDLVVMELFGIEPNAVFGLSTSGKRQAFLRGEFAINQDGTGVFIEKIRNSNEGAPGIGIFTYGMLDADGTIKRDPDLPELPTIPEALEAVYGAIPDTPAYQAYLNLSNRKVPLSKVIALPEGTPQDIVDGYIAVFKEIASMPEMKEALKEEIGSMPPHYGEQTRAALRGGLDMKDSTAEWLNAFSEKNFGTSLF